MAQSAAHSTYHGRDGLYLWFAVCPFAPILATAMQEFLPTTWLNYQSISCAAVFGCTFCSITNMRDALSKTAQKNLSWRNQKIRDTEPSFTGVISDLGGPTANMYRLHCKRRCHWEKLPQTVLRVSWYLRQLTHRPQSSHPTKPVKLVISRGKKILIVSGLRYDLAVKDPEYVKELVTHHVGGYLKNRPRTFLETNVLSKMMKPGMGTYDTKKQMFDKYSREAGKEQYLIPYFIAAHPGTTDTDMMNLAIWLKRNGFSCRPSASLYPKPNGNCYYHVSYCQPTLHGKVTRDSEGGNQR